MPGDTAKVRIQGDATGATKATDDAAKGVKKVADTGEAASKKLARGALDAETANKKFEASVQSSIKRLREKESRATATAAALRRMGKDGEAAARAAGGAGGGAGAGRFAAGAARLLGQAGGIAGVGGATAGGIGAALGAATPALAIFGGAAVAAAGAVAALTAASEKAAQAAGEVARLELARAKIVEDATRQLGATIAGAAAAGGPELRRRITAGGSIGEISATASALGTDSGTAAEFAELTRGLRGDIVAQIRQAFADAERLGGSGIEAARTLSIDAREAGTLGTQSRTDLARAGLGKFGDRFSDNDLHRALQPGRSADRLDALRPLATAEERARFATLDGRGAVVTAQTASAEAAAAAFDPVTKALSEHSKALRDEIKVLDAMNKGQSPIVRGLNDLTSAIKGGAGSYGNQAALRRRIVSEAGF